MFRPHRAAAIALILWGSLAAFPIRSQEVTTGAPVSAVLTIDQERLYAESRWGKRALADLAAASSALQIENRKIEAALTTEEKTLTERRAAMAADEFRKLADDFDTRVTGIRQAQDGKARSLVQQRDSDRQAFSDAALPLMGEVMAARGAVVILDKRAIFVANTAIDVTDEVRAHIDEKLGAGPALPTP